jgi:hypothetical protein
MARGGLLSKRAFEVSILDLREMLQGFNGGCSRLCLHRFRSIRPRWLPLSPEVIWVARLWSALRRLRRTGYPALLRLTASTSTLNQIKAGEQEQGGAPPMRGVIRIYAPRRCTSVCLHVIMCWRCNGYQNKFTS